MPPIFDRTKWLNLKSTGQAARPGLNQFSPDENQFFGPADFQTRFPQTGAPPATTTRPFSTQRNQPQ